MANQSSYPASLDPVPTDKQPRDIVPSSDWNRYLDAVYQLESKVGVDGSLVATSIEYLMFNRRGPYVANNYLLAGPWDLRHPTDAGVAAIAEVDATTFCATSVVSILLYSTGLASLTGVHATSYVNCDTTLSAGALTASSIYTPSLSATAISFTSTYISAAAVTASTLWAPTSYSTSISAANITASSNLYAVNLSATSLCADGMFGENLSLNRKAGIGGYRFEMADFTTNGYASLFSFSDTNNVSQHVDFYKSHQDTEGQTVTICGDALGSIGFYGSSGLTYQLGASIHSEQMAGYGANGPPSALIFSTADGIGVGPTERMRITSAGYVGMGKDDPAGILHIQELVATTNILYDLYTDTTSNSPQISLRKSHQDTEGHVATIDAEALGRVAFHGNSGAGFTQGAVIGAWQVGAHGASYPATKIDFKTSDGTNTVATRMTVDPSGSVGIGTGTSSLPFSNIAGRNYLVIKGSTLGGAVEFQTAQADGQNVVGNIQWVDLNSTATDKRVANIGGSLHGTTANNRGGKLSFATKPDAGEITETLTLDKDGYLGIGATSPEDKLQINKINAAGGLILREYSDTTTTYAYVQCQHSHQDTVGNAATIDGECLGAIVGYGNSGAGFTLGAGVKFVQEGAAATQTPSVIQFIVSDGTTFGERARITSAGYVGINNTNPIYGIDVNALHDNSAGGFVCTTYYTATTAAAAQFRLQKSHQDTKGNTATINTEAIGFITFVGNTGSSFAAGAYIGGEQEGAAGASYLPTGIRFGTSDGSSNWAERMRISKDGYVGIGTTTPSHRLHLLKAADSTIEYMDCYSDTTTQSPAIIMRKSASDTAGTQAATVTTDFLGAITFYGNDGSAFTQGSGIYSQQGGAASTYTPANLQFWTCDGSVAPAYRWVVSSAGVFYPAGNKALNIGITTTGAVDNIYADDFVNEGPPDFSHINILGEMRKLGKPKPKREGTFGAYKEDWGMWEVDPTSLPEVVTNIPQKKYQFKHGLYEKDPITEPPEIHGVSLGAMCTWNYQAICELIEEIDKLKALVGGNP